MKTEISYREFDTNGNYILKYVDIDDLNLSELIELKNELTSGAVVSKTRDGKEMV